MPLARQYSALCKNPERPEACSTMRAPGVLSSAFSLNGSARQGACKHSLFKSIGVIARKSNMATKTIIGRMGFREGLCTQYFQIRLSG